MKKFLIALAAAAALAIAGGISNPATAGTTKVKNPKTGVTYTYEFMSTHTEKGITTTNYKITNDKTGKTGIHVFWIDLNEGKTGDEIIKIEINPAPDSADPYNDPPPGHKDSNPLVPGKGDPDAKAPAQKLAEWQKQFNDLLGGGFSAQGKGSRDELINPDPFGSSGNVPKPPKKDEDNNKFKLDPDHIGQKLGEMEELLQDQFPSLGIDFTNAAYIQHHNPAESQSPGGGGDPAPGGDGGPGPVPGSAAKAASSDEKGGKKPPNMKDAAMGALINPDPLGKSFGQLPSPQGGMGLPGGLGMPGPGAGGQSGGSAPGGGFGLTGPGGGSESSSGRRGRLPKP